MSKPLRYAIALIVILLDQITKLSVDKSLELYEQIKILPVFNITLAYNEGAAFSFLADAGGWQRWLLTGISLVVSVVLAIWLFRMSMRERFTALSISLILGGAVGNLIDRAIYGHVVDFIQVHYKGSYFPSFNIADSAIFCGTALLLWLTLFDKSEEQSLTN
ncbi:MAG: signal peptidase II [Gammaproteobacteria bacterium]|nr:signal peptidase II [Gammaproteobacteria bacterium]